MKFFTAKAVRQFHTHGPAFSTTYAKYKAHLESLKDRLPGHVYELSKPSGMENGVIVRVDHDRSRRVIKLILRCGDMQMGYYNLELTYLDARILPKHDRTLAKIARSTQTQKSYGCDFGYQELDIGDDGRIQHRMIFLNRWQKLDAKRASRWFEIDCRELRWRRVPRRPRRLPPLQDRYPNGPHL